MCADRVFISDTAFIALLGQSHRLTAGYWRQDDRRRNCRFSVKANTVEVRLCIAGGESAGMLLNISSQGMQVAAGCDLSEGDEVEVVVPLDGREYHRAARVREAFKFADQVRARLVFTSGEYGVEEQ